MSKTEEFTFAKNKRDYIEVLKHNFKQEYIQICKNENVVYHAIALLIAYPDNIAKTIDKLSKLLSQEQFENFTHQVIKEYEETCRQEGIQ